MHKNESKMQIGSKLDANSAIPLDLVESLLMAQWRRPLPVEWFLQNDYFIILHIYNIKVFEIIFIKLSKNNDLQTFF